MTPPPTAGTKPKTVTTVPIRPALQTPADTANAMAQAERLALQSDLAWVGEYNGAIIRRRQRAHGQCHQGIPEDPRRQADRRAQSAGARRACRDRATTAGQCRLEDRDRARHRRPARHSRKTRAAAGQRRQRRQMEFADRHRPGRADAAQGSQPHHGKTRRAGEEGARRTHRRLHRGQAGFLRAVGPAGPEEVLSARHVQGRRGPHPHHPLRSGHREHRRAGGDRDVERVQPVSDRRAVGGRRRARPSNTAPASWSATTARSSPTARSPTAALRSRSQAMATPIASPTTRSTASRCCASMARAD